MLANISEEVSKSVPETKGVDVKAVATFDGSGAAAV